MDKPAIIYDTFASLDIRIGTVISAENIEGSEKLLKLKVSFGTEEKQILSGIKAFFPEPNVLVGMQVPVLVNLEPRMMMGLESQGMILAITHNQEVVLLQPTRAVENGSIVR